MPIVQTDIAGVEPNLSFAWYALYTRHQHEKQVTQALVGKGLEVFLPLYTSVHRWKDRDKKVSLPLFPATSSCKARLSAGSPFSPPRGPQCAWVRRKTSDDFRAEIEAVRKVVGSSMMAEPHPFLKCGDRVRLTAGPLQDLKDFWYAREMCGSS